MTDQEIFDGISQKDNHTFLYLYEKYKDRIISMVKKNSGNEDDALDIFQEGLIALWTNISQGKFKVQDNAKIATYFYTLCRNIWINKLRKSKNIQSIEDNSQLEDETDVSAMEEFYEQIKKLENLFAKLSESCKKLLNLFYYEKISLKEISIQLDITEKTAKNNKYRCMQNLRSIYRTENLGQ
ncbi:MAG: sigma-70 family RNA polymerase sigma factor [Bacteroidota bacterium]